MIEVPFASTNPVRPADTHQWRAHYDGGESFDEWDLDGHEHGWAEVEHAHVCTIELLPRRADRQPVLLEVPVGATPRFERRRRLALDVERELLSDAGGVTMLGWDRADQQVRIWVRDDGLIAVSDRDL